MAKTNYSDHENKPDFHGNFRHRHTTGSLFVIGMSLANKQSPVYDLTSSLRLQ